MVPGKGSRVHDLPLDTTNVARGIELLRRARSIAVASEVGSRTTAFCSLKINTGKLSQPNIKQNLRFAVDVVVPLGADDLPAIIIAAARVFSGVSNIQVDVWDGEYLTALRLPVNDIGFARRGLPGRLSPGIRHSEDQCSR